LDYQNPRIKNQADKFGQFKMGCRDAI